MYSYKDSKANIINILKSKTPIEKKDNIPSDSKFTFENGVLTWVASIFIDIENSSELFSKKDEKLARLMRAFVSETICIFQDLDSYNQIGIRGDCVYSIYDITSQEDLIEVFRIAYKLNTFMKMFNKLISDYGYKPINAGIGIGCDEDLIIKAGRTGTGINDKIWIGNAVVDASNLSSLAGRNGIKPIAMSVCMYNNIIDLLKKENSNYSKWIEGHHKNNNRYNKIDFYHCNIINTNFNNWIEEGMK